MSLLCASPMLGLAPKPLLFLAGLLHGVQPSQNCTGHVHSKSDGEVLQLRYEASPQDFGVLDNLVIEYHVCMAHALVRQDSDLGYQIREHHLKPVNLLTGTHHWGLGSRHIAEYDGMPREDIERDLPLQKLDVITRDVLGLG